MGVVTGRDVFMTLRAQGRHRGKSQRTTRGSGRATSNASPPPALQDHEHAFARVAVPPRSLPSLHRPASAQVTITHTYDFNTTDEIFSVSSTFPGVNNALGTLIDVEINTWFRVDLTFSIENLGDTSAGATSPSQWRRRCGTKTNAVEPRVASLASLQNSITGRVSPHGA